MFTYVGVYASMVLFLFISPSPSSPPPLSISLFTMSVSPLLLCKQIHQYHPSRFHVYVLIYNICLYISDLTSLCKEAPDSSTSLELTQMCSFLWLNNMQLHIHTTVFIHSSIDGYLGCFHVIDTVNSAAVNIEVNMTFSILVSSEC